ncbi:MAG: hypothetical protein WCI62_02725 [Erysipelotrichaceae bacterium]
MSLITRTVFISSLGIGYLGVTGLFSNIISILSLADIGVNSVLMFTLYKPLVDDNQIAIKEIVHFFKKIYFMIAFIIAFVGVCIIPLLKYIINLEQPIENLWVYYLLLLSNTVVPYLFVYKSTLILADQRSYLLKTYSIIFSTIQFFAQIFVLIFLHNFILFLVLQVLITVFNNIFSVKITEKHYPFINGISDELDRQSKLRIWSDIKALFLYRIGGIVINNTDNILISTLVGTMAVGYYSNYLILTTSIMAFISVFYSAIQASVGNLSIYDSFEQRDRIYKTISFISFWICGFSTLCFLILFQDFINIWLGKEYLLDNTTMIIVVVNFYMSAMLNHVWLFREAAGLFRKTKYIVVLTSLINIILSIILGKIYGVVGIIGATVIARLVTNNWYEPFILYKYYLKKPVMEYFNEYILRTLFLSLIILFTYFITSFLGGISILTLLLKLLFCILIGNGVFILAFRNKKEFKFVIESFFSMYSKFKNRDNLG